MRLADFIMANVESIVSEWEGFARSIWPGAATDAATLRDHAAAMLRAIAADMDAEQSSSDQAEKSKGKGPNSAHSRRVNRASALHGAGRVQSGFDLPAVLAEYRALRATVVRLWQQSGHALEPGDLDDLARFNESMDQSLTEAVASFTESVHRSHQTFLAILGHDLRDPLNAITLLAQRLYLQKGVDPSFTDAALRITNSSRAMRKIVLDLIDFAGSQIGAEIPVSLSAMDLREVVEDAVSEARAGHPERRIRAESTRDLAMRGDESRLRQVLTNLLGNALQHGAPGGSVELEARREGEEIVLAVHNEGSIPTDKLATLFDPLACSSEPPAGRRAGSIGLGLYIAREIVAAHGGTLEVRSEAAEGTTFTVRLPCG